MRTDKPNLELARLYTRTIGPIGIAVGAAVAVQGAFLVGSALAEFQPIALGAVMMLFGWAAYARTESFAGRVAQWGVTLVFCAGGLWSLLQWAPLLWGSHHTSAGTNLPMVALWLTAGPALFVPGILAALRPGWTPLIVVPALLSLSFAGAIGFGALYMLGVPGVDALSATERAQVVGISGACTIFVLIAGFRAITMWRS